MKSGLPDFVAGNYRFGYHEFWLIEKVHLDDLDLYVVTFTVLVTSVLLWSSVLKLTKKFSSTSFNLKQEVFIRRDEEKDLKRVNI